jgi:hypothetical protein
MIPRDPQWKWDEREKSGARADTGGKKGISVLREIWDVPHFPINNSQFVRAGFYKII